jgi:hypothetical protein
VTVREWLREKFGPVITLLLCSMLIGASIGFMFRAKAEPLTVEEYAFQNAVAICSLLDHDPSASGVAEVESQLAAHGINPVQSEAITILAVNNVCPAHLSLLQVLPAPTVVPAGGAIGGPYRA